MLKSARREHVEVPRFSGPKTLQSFHQLFNFFHRIIQKVVREVVDAHEFCVEDLKCSRRRFPALHPFLKLGLYFSAFDIGQCLRRDKQCSVLRRAFCLVVGQLLKHGKVLFELVFLHLIDTSPLANVCWASCDPTVHSASSVRVSQIKVQQSALRYQMNGVRRGSAFEMARKSHLRSRM
jgi:hypothetical protein